MEIETLKDLKVLTKEEAEDLAVKWFFIGLLIGMIVIAVVAVPIHNIYIQLFG